MKRLILFVIIVAMSIAINDVTAQTVSYTYKALAAEGCSMKYSVAKQNEKFYILHHCDGSIGQNEVFEGIYNDD